MTTQWLETWNVNPIPESDYLAMGEYIYQHYDMILRQLPLGYLPHLQKYVDMSELSLGWDMIFAQAGLLSEPEIAQRILHWLTTEVTIE